MESKWGCIKKNSNWRNKQEMITWYIKTKMRREKEYETNT